MEPIDPDPALLDALSAEARRRSGPAPGDETLFDYLAGRLDEEESERIRTALAAHPEALARLRELKPFVTARAPEAGGPVDLASAAAWRDYKARGPASAPRRVVWIAAALAFVACGLLFRIWQLEADRRRPVTNLKTLELVQGIRAGARPPVLEAAAGEPYRLAVYLPSEAAPCPEYRGELDGPRGRKGLAALVPVKGRLEVLLRAAPGEHDLRISGCGEQVSELRFEIREPRE